ncbi:aminomethyl-transferring glycine dehydrogenase [Elioraea sp.]|uniref:aminomethyl-transferring glycine dehydrogenase n=1 Tax=Elioraea sp. TaxID=2185103 RepID=UPI0025C3CA5E|nr:aminomethyl-transferring glycine dehydrogenase [Elioraea sp.]
MNAFAEFESLSAHDGFVSRHIAPSGAEQAAMLATLGLADRAALVSKTVPASIRTHAAMAIPPARSEAEVLAELAALAAENRSDIRSLIGLGYHGTHVPPVILRNVLENPGWYTAYTPYQAEIAQGRLEALLNYQTVITDLTGMEIANASLLDEGTAAAEAMSLALHAQKGSSKLFLVADDCHPQTLAVVETRARPLGVTVRRVGFAGLAEACAGKPFGMLVQNPSTTGEIRDLTAVLAAAKGAGAMAIVAADLLSLTLMKPPGEMGADVVVGSAQRFGVPFGYGGPHAAFFATRDAFKRQMPGRLVGVSVDAAGRPALRLALQTREQHIRREKATSNICTAQVLLAVMAGMYAVWHGPEGLVRIAKRCNLAARLVADAARGLGFAPRHAAFFDTVTLDCGAKADAVMAAALAKGMNLRRVSATDVGIAMDETVTRADIDALVAALAEASGGAAPAVMPSAPASIPGTLSRSSGFLRQAVFSSHHAEHEMLRYLKRLEDKDVALNRSMIPLGSCTMKLNATAEMIPVTLPGFGGIHPFAPADQAQGYRTLITRLEQWLCAATGFAAVSLQPNAGSAGEYAGLLAIRGWHESRGDTHRDICLIPTSAHGTNPASAVMAGFRVVAVACDKDGNVDIADLRAKAEANAVKLAALMVTYPSTHGVFEEGIAEICAIVHAQGGQVYMDGANMNAQVGLTSPAAIGADVCHLNLHKTFCIPHGGGGPGVGPIGVAAHLAPFLPNHPLVEGAGPATGPGPVASAPWGSAGILPIPYAYIAMMGEAGVREATEVAILNANYIAHRLAPHYPILYRGAEGFVAHECIIDCRGFQASAGVMVEDIAKRLQDYGFHAPTMSWPVAGTLMIEPTESEAKSELDRFCDAMIAIRSEIAAVEERRWPVGDNPLKNAPHTAEEITAETWTHPYSREVAAMPLPFVAAAKYWPPVKRVDNVYGDRNLVCTCEPMESYAEAAE